MADRSFTEWTAIKARARNAIAVGAFAILGSMAINAGAHAQDLKIALITSTTGPFEIYAKQAQAGFQLGMEYATKGTMTVNGRKIVILHKDDQLKPDRARALIEEAYRDDGAEIAVGSTSSANTLAMMPVAEENRKLLVVDIAGADSITGNKWNRYVVRTGRTVGQEATASALLFAEKDTYIVTLAQDYAFGRESTAAFKAAAVKAGATIVAEEYLPIATTDFTGAVERIFNALKDKPGKKRLWVNWIGTTPIPKINAMDPARYGIQLATPGTPLPGMAAFKGVPNLIGAMPYYYEIPKTPANDWLVAEHKKRFNTPPDLGQAFAFDAAIAIVDAIRKAGGTDSEKLISAFGGMTFDGATGPVTIKKENHQALRDFYGLTFKEEPGVEWAIPVPYRKFTGPELDKLTGGK